MITEIIKGVIGVIVVAGAITSILIDKTVAQDFLIPLATFVVGYYFKQVELPAVRRVMAAFKKPK